MLLVSPSGVATVGPGRA